MLEEVEVQRGEILQKARKRSAHVYFPTTAVLSMIGADNGGNRIELAVIGSEGSAGHDVFLRGTNQPNDIIVQRSGITLRLPAADLVRELERRGQLETNLLRHIALLIEQMSKTSVCNQLHTVEDRVIRWLLAMRARAQTDDLAVTQGVIASMLAVRLASVNEVLRRLEKRGIVRLNRGMIRILDQTKLLERSCLSKPSG
jgi:CRP-like cAMP-binding protein